MSQILEKKLTSSQDNSTFRLAVGVVSETVGENYIVIAVKPYQAFRAASCLVLPQLGDTVLFAVGEDYHWIVAVLVRAGERELHLNSTSIYANAANINLSATSIKTNSECWNANHGRIELNAGHFTGQVAVLNWLSDKVSTFVSFLLSRSRNSLREVSEIDSTRCGNFDLKVDETMAMSSKTGVISSQALMKIDSTQIHIG
jgi:hypothetical protein